MSNNAEHVAEVRRLLAAHPEGMTTQSIFDTGDGFLQRSDVAHAVNHLKTLGELTTKDTEGRRTHYLADPAGQPAKQAESEPPAPQPAPRRGHSHTAELLRVLEEADRPLTSREVVGWSDVFEETTTVSQAAFRLRKTGWIVSEEVPTPGPGRGLVHRLATPAEREAFSAQAAEKKPVTRRVSPNRVRPAPAPEQPAQAEKALAAQAALGTLVSSARQVVDAYVDDLGDEHLAQLIQLEREIADTTTGVTA